jgi:Curli production assembly/transport component CsgG
MRWPGVAVVALAALFVGAAPADAASPATLTGKLTGAKLPAAGKGVVPVYAVRLRDGRVIGGTYASAAGRFTLRPPAGSYALVAAVVPFGGSGRVLERIADFVTAKAGKRIALKPTLKKRKARKKKHRASPRTARAAFVNVDYPAIWVKTFDAPPGDFAVMGKGMAAMLITDLSATIGKCDGVVVEREHLDEIIKEIDRQQSKYFDPSTRVQKGKLIANNGTVSGSLTVSGDTLTVSATYHDQRTGRTKTVSVSGPKDDIFALEDRLAPLLTNAICPHTPNTYAATSRGPGRPP